MNKIKLILAELKYTDDIKMGAKHVEIVAKYAPLISQLEKAGWVVQPETASIVIGHRSTALLTNQTAFETLGIKSKKARQEINNKLVDVSLRYTRTIVNTTRRFRAAHTNRNSPLVPAAHSTT